jgi:hypothetical protein
MKFHIEVSPAQVSTRKVPVNESMTDVPVNVSVDYVPALTVTTNAFNAGDGTGLDSIWYWLWDDGEIILWDDGDEMAL